MKTASKQIQPVEETMTQILDSRFPQFYTADTQQATVTASLRFVHGFRLRGKNRTEMTNTRDVEHPVVRRKLTDTRGIRL